MNCCIHYCTSYFHRKNKTAEQCFWLLIALFWSHFQKRNTTRIHLRILHFCSLDVGWRQGSRHVSRWNISLSTGLSYRLRKVDKPFCEISQNPGESWHRMYFNTAWILCERRLSHWGTLERMLTTVSMFLSTLIQLTQHRYDIMSTFLVQIFSFILLLL